MKNSLIFHTVILTFLLGGMLSATPSFAQSFPGFDSSGGEEQVDSSGSESGSRGIAITNPIIADNIQELFQAIIDIVLVFAVPIIVFFIIYAGFMYVTAQGDPGKIQKAHMALLFALIGGLLILGARVLIEVVGGTVDVFKE